MGWNLQNKANHLPKGFCIKFIVIGRKSMVLCNKTRTIVQEMHSD